MVDDQDLEAGALESLAAQALASPPVAILVEEWIGVHFAVDLDDKLCSAR